MTDKLEADVFETGQVAVDVGGGGVGEHGAGQIAEPVLLADESDSL